MMMNRLRCGRFMQGCLVLMSSPYRVLAARITEGRHDFAQPPICKQPARGDNSRMQIERHEIRCFQAVIDAGGFSRAAERLDLSQSAVSQAIANLEHRLGTVLLRRGNPPQLTEAGIRLLR